MDYTAILSRKYPNSQWTLNGDKYIGLIWLSDTPKPSQEELDALWIEVKAEIAAETQAKIKAKNDLLTRLGISAEDLQLLLANSLS